jgi:hypothetical protein
MLPARREPLQSTRNGKEPQQREEEALCPKEVAIRLGIKEKKAWELMSSGAIESFRAGVKIWRCTPEHLQQYIARNSRTGVGGSALHPHILLIEDSVFDALLLVFLSEVLKRLPEDHPLEVTASRGNPADLEDGEVYHFPGETRIDEFVATIRRLFEPREAKSC